MKLPNKYLWDNYYLENAKEKELQKFFQNVHRKISIRNLSKNFGDSLNALKMNYGNVYKELQWRENQIIRFNCTSFEDYKYFDMWPLIILLSPTFNSETIQHKTLVEAIDKFGKKLGVYIIWTDKVDGVKQFPYQLG